MSISRSGNRLSCSNIPLQMLITWAYDITDDGLFGKPSWLDSTRYDVVAESPEGRLRIGGFQQMMQSLLATRFNLSAHHESRRLSTYALVVGKNGPKVHLTEAPEIMPQNPFTMTDAGHLSGAGVSAQMLAKVLSSQLGRSVIDQTRVKGVFDFTLEWAPDTGASIGAERPPETQARASIFTAILEQLGFKLETRTAAVDVLVIDHVERTPSDN